MHFMRAPRGAVGPRDESGSSGVEASKRRLVRRRCNFDLPYWSPNDPPIVVVWRRFPALPLVGPGMRNRKNLPHGTIRNASPAYRQRAVLSEWFLVFGAHCQVGCQLSAGLDRCRPFRSVTARETLKKSGPCRNVIYRNIRFSIISRLEPSCKNTPSYGG